MQHSKWEEAGRREVRGVGRARVTASVSQVRNLGCSLNLAGSS